MATKIHALADEVINQIAAGEVIERPASVVKELVENSLDAGATDIRVSIEAGGKDLIRIVDNGHGMEPADLELCPLRHTTSKLLKTDDLIRIATNGFRGEAVASIASVSHLRIESRTVELDVGAYVELESGMVATRDSIARPVGTTFLVRDLFHSTPVRRNFLGSEALETAKISDVVTRIAIAHPDKRFELMQGARELFLGLPGPLRSRIAEALGVGLAKQLLEFDYLEGSIRVRGFASSPEDLRGKRNLQYFYLGQRPIWNSVIAKAVQRAYEPYGKAGFPVVVLFVEMEGAEFDVNVHPAKREVRFSNENSVFLAVHHAVRQALMTGEGTSPVVSLSQFISTPEAEPQPETTPSMASVEARSDQQAQSPGTFSPPPPRQSSPLQLAPKFQSPQPNVVAAADRPRYESKAPVTAEPQDLFSQPEYGKIVHLSPKLFQRPTEARTKSPDMGAPARFFQCAKTYVVCEDSHGLLVVDQNAASQRILYDRAIHALDQGRIIESQELLFPEIVEMTRAEGVLLQEHLAELDKLGFHLEPFGGGAWQLRGIPVQLAINRAEMALRGFLQQLSEPFGPGATGPREALAKAFALGSALQAGVELGAEEMSALVEQLVLTADPFQSPTGKPCLLRLPLDELHKRFRRNDS